MTDTIMIPPPMPAAAGMKEVTALKTIRDTDAVRPTSAGTSHSTISMWNPKKRFGLPGLIAVEVEVPIVDCWQSCPEQDAWLEQFGAAVPPATGRASCRDRVVQDV